MRILLLSTLLISALNASAMIIESFDREPQSQPKAPETNCVIVFKDQSSKLMTLPVDGNERTAVDVIRALNRQGLISPVAAVSCGNGVVIDPRL